MSQSPRPHGAANLQRSRARHLVSCCFVLGLCAIVLAVSGCAPRAVGRGGMYVETSFRNKQFDIRRVAIVPNRLPASLQDPEKWRRFNWSIIANALRQRGYDVVPYKASVRGFLRSGLPVEDTSASREKYAGLARNLGVDAIFVPYYATMSSAKGGFLGGTFSFVAIATLQIYMTETNDFLARIDAQGVDTYKTGGLTAGGLGMLLGGTLFSVLGAGSEGGLPVIGQVFTYTGGALTLFGAFIDGISGSVPVDARFRSGFKAGLNKGLQPFFRLTRPARGGRQPRASGEAAYGARDNAPRGGRISATPPGERSPQPYRAARPAVAAAPSPRPAARRPSAPLAPARSISPSDAPRIYAQARAAQGVGDLRTATRLHKQAAAAGHIASFRELAYIYNGAGDPLRCAVNAKEYLKRAPRSYSDRARVKKLSRACLRAASK